MKKILVVSPHPDDETLGCGGTLLRHKAQGDQLYWLNVTVSRTEQGFTPESVRNREVEIAQVKERYGFRKFFNLGFPTTRLDQVPAAEMVRKVKEVVEEIRPEEIYSPYGGDAHTDHRAVFNAVAACGKTFRAPFVKRILIYETLSETEFGVDPKESIFRPNVFVDIAPYLNEKIEIMKIYQSEMGKFPFPRSEKAIQALAALRGSTAGFEAAEAFMLLKEVIGQG